MAGNSGPFQIWPSESSGTLRWMQGQSGSVLAAPPAPVAVAIASRGEDQSAEQVFPVHQAFPPVSCLRVISPREGS